MKPGDLVCKTYGFDKYQKGLLLTTSENNLPGSSQVGDILLFDRTIVTWYLNLAEVVYESQ